MQLGGGELNEKGRVTWHQYMTGRYGFGNTTGIEQGYETGGTIPDPKNGYGLNLQYANTAFGQGMSATPLQMGAALAAILNGGTYYKPHLVAGYFDEGKLVEKPPEVARRDVISAGTSEQMVGLMQNVVDKNYLVYSMKKPDPSYRIGGKTGTAQVHKPASEGGGYYEDKFNGMFIGFIGGDDPEYVIVVRVNEPKIAGYAGSQAAAPIFGKLVNMLITNSSVTPKKGV